MLLKLKAITFAILSTGSVALAAAVRYSGAEDQKSTILWIDDLGSKILIGNEMWEIESPLSNTKTSCFATLARTPYCFWRVATSVHTRAPSSLTIRPCRIVALSLGRGNKMIFSDKWIGAGLSKSTGDFLSAKEFGPTNTFGQLVRSISYEIACRCSSWSSIGSSLVSDVT